VKVAKEWALLEAMTVAEQKDEYFQRAPIINV
jgi:hypothetical protein